MTEETERGSGVRTLALLNLVAVSGTLTLSQLAATSRLPISSVHRLLQPLLQSGMVERTDGQAYCAGSELLRLASLVVRNMDVGRLARPILRRLWEEWEETCSLCLYKPATQTAIVMETIQTPHPLRFVIEPFAELSLIWGSLGRAILAHLPPMEMAAAMERPGLGPLSGLPQASAGEMADVIARAQAQGYVHYHNETMDAAGVAAPVRRGDGRILGSLGITAPARRLLPELVPAMAEAVIVAADELSELLGWRLTAA